MYKFFHIHSKNFQRNIDLTNALIIFRMLSQEAGRADRNRHYGLYIDGDIAKLPGGMFFQNNIINCLIIIYAKNVTTV